jgi:hypothetical protein
VVVTEGVVVVVVVVVVVDLVVVGVVTVVPVVVDDPLVVVELRVVDEVDDPVVVVAVVVAVIGAPLHGTPLRAKSVGSGLLELHVPWKPKETVPPAGILALKATLVALTAVPFWETVAFQAEVTFWPAPNVHVSVQPLTATGEVMSTLAVNPPAH